MVTDFPTCKSCIYKLYKQFQKNVPQCTIVKLTGMELTRWAQEHFQKLLSVNRVQQVSLKTKAFLVAFGNPIVSIHARL